MASSEPDTAARCESVHFDWALQCELRAGHNLSKELHMARFQPAPPRLEQILVWRDEEAIDHMDLEGAYAIAEVVAANRARKPAPDVLLVQARLVLDQLEHQARAATPGPWRRAPWHDRSVMPTRWVEDVLPIAERGPFMSAMASKRADAAHIAAWSPSMVLTVVGMLRATVDGWEQVLADHFLVDVDDGFGDLGTEFYCDWCGGGNPCPDRARALAGLERLASLDMIGAKQ